MWQQWKLDTPELYSFIPRPCLALSLSVHTCLGRARDLAPFPGSRAEGMRLLGIY